LGINRPGFLHPEDERKVFKLFSAVVNENNKILTANFRVLSPQGNYIWLETFFNNLLHDKAVNAVVLNFRDITGRKNNEAERKQLISELTKSNTELKQYTYITSHNLRSPLTNLISIINLIEWEKITDDNTRLLLHAFKEFTFHFNDTLNDLMEAILIKKSGANKQTELLFSDMNDKVTRSLNSLIEQSNATITSNFVSAPTVQFDAVYLESIFTNLISNALKYASPLRRLQVNLKSCKVEDGIELIFVDNGIGMDMTVIKERIFGLHQRFHNNTDSKGVGLYLVQSQMNALGGSIKVTSTINVGTTFTLNFKNQPAYA
jgi:light-regulated signal transduction histidine kinase (bacteriophytochrome)